MEATERKQASKRGRREMPGGGAGRRAVRNTGIVSQYYIENHHAPLVNREVFGVTGELVRRRILYKRRVHFSEKDRLLIREARTLALREWGAALETGRRWEREG